MKLLITPADAQQNGIADGDMVCVESPRGTVDIKSKVTDEVRPGILEQHLPLPEDHAERDLQQRERLTGHVPGV